MKTYYLEFCAREVAAGTADSQTKEKRVRFWVVDRDPDGALRRAHHYLVQNGWQPEGLEQAPVEVLPAKSDIQDEEAVCFEQAQRFGIFMAVVD